MHIYFLFAIMLACPWLPALNNPFSCNRTITRTTKPHASIFKNFKFIGVIGTDTQRSAIIQWHGNLHTLQAGDSIGPISIKEINAKNMRIVAAKEEFILTLKSE